MADIIDFSQWEQLLATAKDLIKATNTLFEMIDDPKSIDTDVYVSIIKMHNSAVDYIVSLENIKNKEEN